MSEKIYALLLRLQPEHFREVYGHEALQLFRDRCRDEQGFMAAVRLWFDLVIDLFVSLPRTRAGRSSYRYVTGAPAFVILEARPPQRSALMMGALLSLLTLAAFPDSINHFGNGSSPRGPLNAPFAFFQTESIGDKTKLDATERRSVVRKVAENLKEHYVSREMAAKLADALLDHEKSGDYDGVVDGQAFAALLTKQLRDLSQDLHLEVVYSRQPLREGPASPSPESEARYRAALQQENCTFEKVEVLPHNIGYLKINSFPRLSICEPIATAAMSKLNHAGALIVDLRDNRGGFGEAVMFLSAYLFDHPEYVFSPKDKTTLESWTRSPVADSRLSDKPLFVLTSARTISAAELFTYNMKMLKRATLVGETTAGGAHAGVFYAIDPHFGVAVYEVSPINPYSKADWEGVGVEPDVKVKAADALKRAVELAESRLSQK